VADGMEDRTKPVLTFFDVVSQRLPGGAEENQGNAIISSHFRQNNAVQGERHERKRHLNTILSYPNYNDSFLIT
jgi:hypothetical protein